MDSDGNVVFNFLTVSESDLKDFSLFDDSTITDRYYPTSALLHLEYM